MSERTAPQWGAALLRTIVLVAVMAAIMTLTGLDVWHALVQGRGVETGLADDAPALAQPRFAANVDLDRYTERQEIEALAMLHDLGFETVRQRIPWEEIEPEPGQWEWERWDRLVSLMKDNDLGIVAVLDTSPTWARSSWEADNPYAPPTDPRTLAEFAGELAIRYGESIIAYQVWDQPNIAPHWGKDGPADPRAYVELLRLTAQVIHEAAPNALVISAGLAPNTEPGGRNMSDITFLREIYRLGGADAFDVLGALPYGFWSGPDDRRVDAEVLNFSRVILMREEMLRRGDGHKPVWALDGGWCALPPSWEGEAAPQGSDLAEIQSDRLDRALARIEREWPWMTLVSLQRLWPAVPTSDPTWGFALIGQDGRSTGLLDPFTKRLTSKPVCYPGLSTEADRLLLSLNGGHGFSVWGTDVALGLDPALLLASNGLWAFTQGALSADPVRLVEGRWRAAMTEVTAETLPPVSPDGLAWVTVATGLAPDQHYVRIEAAPEALAAIQSVRIGRRAEPWIWLHAVLIGGVALALIAASAWRSAQQVPWRRPVRWARGHWTILPEVAQVGAISGAVLIALLAPMMPLRLLGIGLYGALALLRPDHALLLAVAAIPLAPLHVTIGPGSFSVTEICLLAAVWGAAAFWALVGRDEDTAHAKTRASFTLLDGAVLALVLLGLATSLVAEYQRVALREWRVMVIEPALLYLLIRRTALRYRGDSRRWLMMLLDALWVSAVGVAIYALLRYPQASGTIVAEGVRRARGFYGSPNNLALYLERVLPLGIAVALWGGGKGTTARRRRWVYGLGALPIALAVLLTFSRGAWLLGIPAALLTMVFLRGGRWRWAWALGTSAGLALLVLLSAPAARLGALLGPTSGRMAESGTLFLRLQLWRASWAMALDHPWLGVGLDNFLYYYGDYILPGAEVDRWLSHPHNILLDFWLRLGAGGLVVLGGLAGGMLRQAGRALQRWPWNRNTREMRAAYVGLIAGAAALLAHGLVDSSYFVTELAYWFLFCLAWLSRAARSPYQLST